jgi:hypothetical protein
MQSAEPLPENHRSEEERTMPLNKKMLKSKADLELYGRLHARHQKRSLPMKRGAIGKIGKPGNSRQKEMIQQWRECSKGHLNSPNAQICWKCGEPIR